jgi:hypothetical protein
MLRDRHVQGHASGYQNDFMAFKCLAYLKASKIMTHAQDVLAVINDFHGSAVFMAEARESIPEINSEN